MEFSSDCPDTKKEKIPLKIGVRCQPPALTLLYREGDTKRVRIMPVRFLNKFGALNLVIQEMKSHHEIFLKQVPDLKIEKMLRILQEIDKGASIEKASTLVCNEYSVDPEQDLNKLSDEELSKKKKVMDKSFFKNQLKDGDEGYQYDIQIDFQKEDKTDAGWDSDEENFWS